MNVVKVIRTKMNRQYATLAITTLQQLKSGQISLKQESEKTTILKRMTNLVELKGITIRWQALSG